MDTELRNQIIQMLAENSQRATYGALASLVGGPARSVMAGLEPTPDRSFIVNKRTGWPSSYGEPEVSPFLLDNPQVLSHGDELNAWLVNA
jgi:hypothetical protein